MSGRTERPSGYFYCRDCMDDPDLRDREPLPVRTQAEADALEQPAEIPADCAPEPATEPTPEPAVG